MKSLPSPWAQSEEAAKLWRRLSAARRSVLMLDYDGTLAPFREERSQAYPYVGLPERLAALARLESVRLALVSGRPARELRSLLDAIPGLGGERIEIWGDHGQERLRSDGSYSLRPLGEPERAGIELVKKEIAREIARLGFPRALEAKPASLAIHWRGLAPEEQTRIRSAVEAAHLQRAGESGLRLLEFDGGIELRLRDGGKGAAVEQILAEEGDGVTAAYLGDDLTDEDAFSAAGSRAISILVRSERRKSAARFWLRPPEELLDFLDSWIRAAVSGGNLL